MMVAEVVVPESTVDSIEAAISGLAAQATVELRDNPLPSLYDLAAAGQVYYAKEDPEAQTWHTPHLVLERGWGDCKHFSAWRVGELRNAGAKAMVKVIDRRDADHPGRFHAVVEHDDGSIEDPSLIVLGLAREARLDVGGSDMRTEVKIKRNPKGSGYSAAMSVPVARGNRLAFASVGDTRADALDRVTSAVQSLLTDPIMAALVPAPVVAGVMATGAIARAAREGTLDEIIDNVTDPARRKIATVLQTELAPTVRDRRSASGARGGRARSMNELGVAQRGTKGSVVDNRGASSYGAHGQGPGTQAWTDLNRNLKAGGGPPGAAPTGADTHARVGRDGATAFTSTPRSSNDVAPTRGTSGPTRLIDPSAGGGSDGAPVDPTGEWVWAGDHWERPRAAAPDAAPGSQGAQGAQGADPMDPAGYYDPSNPAGYYAGQPPPTPRYPYDWNPNGLDPYAAWSQGMTDYLYPGSQPFAPWTGYGNPTGGPSWATSLYPSPFGNYGVEMSDPSGAAWYSQGAAEAMFDGAARYPSDSWVQQFQYGDNGQGFMSDVGAPRVVDGIACADPWRADLLDVARGWTEEQPHASQSLTDVADVADLADVADVADVE